jgi:RNA polymerase sigma-70 factor (ECF subfamily)
LSRSSDEDLMVLVGRGDLQAFEHLVERYKVGVFSLCFQILRSREDAEEASQDTFIKAFRARDVYDPTRKVAPWLLRIASNAARDVLRKRETRIVVDTDLLVAEADALPDRRDDRSDAQRVDSEEVQRVLGELSEGYRMPLVLKYLNGLTNQEIAESLGMSLSSLKVRLARAREILHSRLWRRLKP